MDKVDATIILFFNSKLRRASAFYRGNPAEVASLLVASGIKDPAFGEIILSASHVIADEIQKRSNNEEGE